MRRTTIMLPLKLKEKAARHAAEAKLSLGELIRQLLEQKLKNSYQIQDSFFSDQEIYIGETPKDLAKNHDTYLYGEKR